VYNDKQATLERFKANYQEKLSEAVKKRLVLENDEVLKCYRTCANQGTDVVRQMCYNIDDLLTVCPDLDIPIVIDYHHDWINVCYVYTSQLLTDVPSTPALLSPSRRAHTYSERNLGTQRDSRKATPLRTTPGSSNNDGTPGTCRPVQVAPRLSAG